MILGSVLQRGFSQCPNLRKMEVAGRSTLLTVQVGVTDQGRQLRCRDAASLKVRRFTSD